MEKKLKYVGNKIYVNHKGITFGNSEDKYNYLQEVVLLLEGVKGVDNNTFKLPVSTVVSMRDDELQAKIIYDDVQAKIVDERMSYYKKKLENEDSDVDRLLLDDIEKDYFKENLNLTRDDRLQRAYNKTIYHMAISQIVKIIFDKKIKFIEVPYTPDFNHVIYSIRNTLRANQPTLTVTRSYELRNQKVDIVLNNNFMI